MTSSVPLRQDLRFTHVASNARIAGARSGRGAGAAARWALDDTCRVRLRIGLVSLLDQAPGPRCHALPLRRTRQRLVRHRRRATQPGIGGGRNRRRARRQRPAKRSAAGHFGRRCGGRGMGPRSWGWPTRRLVTRCPSCTCGWAWMVASTPWCASASGALPDHGSGARAGRRPGWLQRQIGARQASVAWSRPFRYASGCFRAHPAALVAGCTAQDGDAVLQAVHRVITADTGPVHVPNGAAPLKTAPKRGGT